ncbi:MAG: hypothetical protein PHD76_03670 [Methylacidiphilales bacterium]|nr:hypothetical protein [Candidatus Methylacidiphilales bacterium]
MATESSQTGGAANLRAALPKPVEPDPADARVRQIETEKRELQAQIDELAAWQTKAVAAADAIYAKHQQLLKELSESKAALNEAESKLSMHKREIDILKLDFKNLQQALARAEQEANHGRHTESELERCKKRLAELESKAIV